MQRENNTAIEFDCVTNLLRNYSNRDVKWLTRTLLTFTNKYIKTALFSYFFEMKGYLYHKIIIVCHSATATCLITRIFTIYCNYVDIFKWVVMDKRIDFLTHFLFTINSANFFQFRMQSNILFNYVALFFQEIF